MYVLVKGVKTKLIKLEILVDALQLFNGKSIRKKIFSYFTFRVPRSELTCYYVMKGTGRYFDEDSAGCI